MLDSKAFKLQRYEWVSVVEMTMNEILITECVLMNIINWNVNEQNLWCVGAIRFTKITECKLTSAVGSQLTSINRTEW
jgi:hypothetical protein